MADFIMTVGPSYSGKSRWAQEARFSNKVIVSTDAIRGELYGDESIQDNPSKVFDIAHSRIAKYLLEGKNVIFDATNLNAKRRMGFLKWIDNMRIPNITKICMVFAADFETILTRMNERERKVSLEVVRRQISQFQTPSLYEGWDEVFLNATEKLSLEDIFDAGRGISHDNPHHELNITEHMEAALKEYEKRVPFFEFRPDVGCAIKYHDIGKFFTKTFYTKDGTRKDTASYYNHENVGAYMVLAYDTEFKLMDEEKLEASFLICYHMEHFKRKEQDLEKFYNQIGSTKGLLKIVEECDLEAH